MTPMISQNLPNPRLKLTDALNYKIGNYQRILDLPALKVSLSEGNPVVFGFKVYESFESKQTAQTGQIPIPKSKELLLGGHAVLAVGYVNTSAARGYVIVRNSWGESWGDQGYCYMPYGVFNNLVLDMWTGK